MNSPRTDEASLPDAPPTLAHYQLRARLGEGGFGQVFEAWDTQLQRSVAIKRLKLTQGVDPEKLVHEARMAASLRHPAFVKIHAIEDEGDSKAIVMEMVPGPTLRMLAKTGPQDEALALEMVRQVAEAMQEAHAAGLIHGDLKPANLILEPNGKVRILDFGLASHADAQETGSVAELDPQGTIAYMAPERLLGAAPSAQGDIYALGVILYELLSGARPFASLSGLALAAAHVQSSSANWSFPENTTPDVVRLVQAMTARQTAQRLASMQEVAERIAASGKAITAGRPAAATPHPLRQWFARWRFSVLVTAGGLAVALAAWTAIPYFDAFERALTPYSESLTMKQGLDALRVFDRRGSLDVAEKNFNLVLAHDPENAAAAAGLSINYSLRYSSENKDPTWLQKANASAQQALKLNDQLVLSQVAMAYVLNNQGKSEQALIPLSRALYLDPKNIFALLCKVDLLTRLQRYEEAMREAEAGLKIYPRDQRFANDIGTIYFEQGNYKAAEQAFRQSIALQPDAVIAYANLDAVLLKQNRIDEALQVLQQGLQIRPSARLYGNLGTDLFYRGDYVAAAEAFEHAVSPDRGNPNDYLNWANLADTLLWLPGRKAEAKKAYDRARELLAPMLASSPDNVTTVSRMALYSARAGDKKKADTLIRHATALAPTSPNTHFRAGLTYELIGNRTAALEELAKAKQFGYPAKAIESEPDLVDLRRDARYPQH